MKRSKVPRDRLEISFVFFSHHTLSLVACAYVDSDIAFIKMLFYFASHLTFRLQLRDSDNLAL